MSSEEEAREAVEVAYQLGELAKRPEWQYLVDFVRTFATSRQNRLLNMSITSLEDVGTIVRESGWINGAQFVLNAPTTAQGIAEGAKKTLPVEDDK